MDDTLAALGGATGWLHSPPLTGAGLRGRVVLVDFCTFTCINWLRTLPYLRAWRDRYEPHGLTLIGVHTPEFDVEADESNVRRALDRLGVDYPVAIDNDYAVWDGFANRYWPALYLIDAEGELRHQWFGEGDYDRAERAVRKLLAEAGATDLGSPVGDVGGDGVLAAADWAHLRSPETYLGYERGERLTSPESRLSVDHWALGGDWRRHRQAAVSEAPGGRIAFRFHARDLHLVMGPAEGGGPIRFDVRLDGELPGAAHGEDINAAGEGSVAEPRLYQLVRQPGHIRDRTVEITFHDAGLRAYAVTFG